MKVYEAVFKDGQEGVFGISLVEDPAMEDYWITLSEQKTEIQFAAVDEAKHLLLGAVLIPNKKIYRNIDGNEFYITFSEETIGKLAHNFIKSGYQNNSSAEHEVQLSDVSFVESWQVEDSEKDKSALYGKTYEKGTWVVMAKVSPGIYQQAKDGTFKGFSVDAWLGLQEYNLKSDNMTKTDFLDAIKTLLGQDTKKEEVAVEQVEVKSEEVVETAEADTTQEEEIVEVIDAPEMEDFVNAITEMKKHFDGQIEALKTEFSKQIEKEVEEKEEKIVELEKQAEVEPIKAGAKEEVEIKESAAPSIKGRVQQNLRNFWE